jgi:hypothetical protein
MAPPAGEHINVLEATTEKLQEDMDELRQEQIAHRVANRKKFATLEKSISDLDVKTQANIDALGTKMQANIDTLGAKMQASIDALARMVQMLQASQAKDLAAIIVLLTPRCQSTQLPTTLLMLATMSLLTGFGTSRTACIAFTSNVTGDYCLFIYIYICSPSVYVIYSPHSFVFISTFARPYIHVCLHVFTP